jgi:hypothetical protein
MNDFPLRPDMKLISEVTTRFNDDCDFDPPPDAHQICRVLNTAFWASMQSEEGHPVRATLALMDSELGISGGIFNLSDPIALSSHAIAKLSASFPYRPGAVAVSFSQGPPVIWGLVLPKPIHGWLVEILGPGYIVIRNAPSVEAALLPDGSQIRFQGARLEDEWCKLFFEHTHHTVLREIPFEYSAQFYGLLHPLSQAMVDHHRGASVLIVDPRDAAWRSAVDFKYEFNKPEEYLFALLCAWRKWQKSWWQTQDQAQKKKKRPTNELSFLQSSKQQDELERAFKLVGGLTAVDGAMVMTTDLKILGYGAKLNATAKKLKIREWLPGRHKSESPKDLQGIGGTRHQSAAQFVSRYPKTIVFVASQDGRFTIFCSDEGREGVNAVRAELLLL